MPKISVIVPMFNAEQYLDHCISSILSQTLSELEVILIDDGSFDNTLEIAKSWKNRDSRVIVYHKENEGIGSAVCDGIRVATGKYVIFVDSDDWIQRDYCEMLYTAKEEYDADCIMCGYMRVSSSGDTYATLEQSAAYTDKTIETDILRPFWEDGISLFQNWSNSRWCKLFRMDYLKEIDLGLLKGLSMGEDTLLNLLYLPKCHTIVKIPCYCGYMLRENPDSISRKYRHSLIKQNRDYIQNLEQLAMKEGRAFVMDSGIRQQLFCDLLWLAAESELSLKEKIAECTDICKQVDNLGEINTYFENLNILFKFGFWLISKGQQVPGVIWLHTIITTIHRIKR